MTKHKEHEHKPGAQPGGNHETAPRQEGAPASAPEAKAPEQPVKSDAEKAAEEIASLKKALAEAEDKRIRTLAEMDNLRKRLAKDMEAQRFSIQADTLSAFLQVFDHFTMAVNAAKSSDNLKALLDGMKMIDAEFGRAFQETGVEFINAEGKDFDPNIHEAVSHEPSDSVAAGKVLRQWSSACKMGQRLLRPARVVVSAGPQTATSEAVTEEP